MPNFTMKCFILPIGLIHDLEHELQRYWWVPQIKEIFIGFPGGYIVRRKKMAGLGLKIYKFLIWQWWLSNVEWS